MERSPDQKLIGPRIYLCIAVTLDATQCIPSLFHPSIMSRCAEWTISQTGDISNIAYGTLNQLHHLQHFFLLPASPDDLHSDREVVHCVGVVGWI